MKTQKGFVGLFLTVVIAVIVLAGGAYLIMRTKSPPSPLDQEKSSNTSNIDYTAKYSCESGPYGLFGYVFEIHSDDNLLHFRIPSKPPQVDIALTQVKIPNGVKYEGPDVSLVDTGNKITVTYLGKEAQNCKNVTAGWKTYTSAQYGFEFKYPPQFELKENTLQLKNISKHVWINLGNSDTKFEVAINYASVNDCYKNPVSDREYVKVENINSNQFREGSFGDEAMQMVSETKMYAIVHNNLCYQLSLQHDRPRNMKDDNSQAENYFKQILSTFKFTNKTSTSTTQDIKISGITITIPANWRSRAPNIDDACMRSAHCSQSAMADGSGSYKLYNPQVTTADKISDPDAIYITAGECDSICPVYPNPIDYPNRSTVFLQGLTISTYGHNAEAVSVYNSIVIQLQ